MYTRCIVDFIFVYLQADTSALYDALGVSKECSQSEIKRAYMKLARKVRETLACVSGHILAVGG